jgi:hypothetical protein
MSGSAFLCPSLGTFKPAIPCFRIDAAVGLTLVRIPNLILWTIGGEALMEGRKIVIWSVFLLEIS